MAVTTYEPEMTMATARARYFEVNGFGPSGGYDDAWVDFKLGPVPFPFPNTKGRIRSVKVHDLHHILTNYDTSITGEFEISGWELGAGCRDHYAAWQLNLGGMFAGLLVAPRRTFRAFMRGRRSESLYDRSIDELLPRTVRELREETGVERASAVKPTARDLAVFALCVIGGGISSAFALVVGLTLLPLGLLAAALRKRGKTAPTPA